MVTRMSNQPRFDLGVLMSGVVVYYQMNVQFGRNVCINVTKKMQELLVTVTLLALGQNPSVGDIQSGEKRGSAMADVVMGYPFDISQSHG